MDVEDILEPEVAAAAAITAVVASPQVRHALRRGAVYGLAGLLVAGDAISTFSRGVGRGMQRMATSASTDGATDSAANSAAEEGAGDNGGR